MASPKVKLEGKKIAEKVMELWTNIHLTLSIKK